LEARPLIFEQWKGGHSTNYLRYLVPKIADLADEVIAVVTASFYRMQEFQQLRMEWTSSRQIQIDWTLPEADPELPLRERAQLLRNLRRKIREHRPDFVFVLSGDAQTLAATTGRAAGAR
jgi:hypothetical protein